MNNKIIKIFNKLTQQIESQIDTSSGQTKITNIFRLKSIQTSIDILKKLPYKITNKTISKLQDIKQIGPGTIRRINEILKTGTLSEITTIPEQSNIVAKLLNVFGIGKHVAQTIISQNNISSISELKSLVKSNQIVLPDNILKGLKYYNKILTKIPRNEIDQIDLLVRKQLGKIDQGLVHVICGSYRRGADVSGDVDILITHKLIRTKSQVQKLKINYLEQFVTQLIKQKFIIESLTKTSVNTKYMGLYGFKKGTKTSNTRPGLEPEPGAGTNLGSNPIYPDKVRRIDIRFVPAESFYYGLLYFTGSKNFNRKLRQIALQKSLKLNEYGLFKNNKSIKADSEEEIFKLLDIPYVNPSDR